MSEQRAFANKEREFQARRLSRLARAGLMALATLLSFSAVVLVAIDQLYRPDTFVIDQLKIKGAFRYLDPADVESVVGPELLTNFFSVQLSEVKRRVESLPWVHYADVRREWPNTLLVNVREHIPVMRWKDDQWITSTGKVIDLPGDIRLSNVMTLSGNESDSGLVLKHAFRWKKQFVSSGLELREVHLSASRSWRLQIFHAENSADFELLLGREETQERIVRFQALFDQQFRGSNKQLTRVDARYPDGLAIRMNQLDIDEIGWISETNESEMNVTNNEFIEKIQFDFATLNTVARQSLLQGSQR